MDEKDYYEGLLLTVPHVLELEATGKMMRIVSSHDMQAMFAGAGVQDSFCVENNFDDNNELSVVYFISRDEENGGLTVSAYLIGDEDEYVWQASVATSGIVGAWKCISH